MKEQRNNRYRKTVKKRKRAAFFFKMLLFVLIITASVSGVSVFFKINELTVVGESRYTKEEILSTLGVTVGDNLIFIEKISMAQRVIAKFVYIDEIKINRIFPDKLEIIVADSVPVYQTKIGGKNFLIDAKGKALEEATASGLIELVGFSQTELKIGENLFGGKGVEVSDLTQIIAQLNQNGLMGDVKKIDVTERLDLRIWYTDLYEIKMGTIEELEKKIRFLMTVKERLGDGRKGVIDVSNASVARFIPYEE